MSSNTTTTYASRVKARFTLLYGLIGFVSTNSLLILQLSGTTNADVFFTYALITVIPCLAAVSVFAWKKRAMLASSFALFTILLGCLGAITLAFAAALSLIMIFIFSSMFITLKKWQILSAYLMMTLALGFKLMIEAQFFSLQSIPPTHLSQDSLVFIGVFLFSIFAYALVTNIILNRGVADSATLVETTEQLNEANKVKNHFLSLISHDMKGPIGSVGVYLDLLIDRSVEMDEDFLIKLRDSNRHAYQLLENLLLWSNLHEKTISPTIEKVGLYESVSKTIELLQLTAENKNIQLHNECGTDIYVLTDADMLMTIIRNLLSNAIKYSHHSSKIEIHSRGKNGMLEVSVIDHGIGMTKEQRHAILSCGNESNSTLGTADEKGTGVGLIMTRDFIDALGGTLGVESELGKGSRFWFTLPAAN